MFTVSIATNKNDFISTIDVTMATKRRKSRHSNPRHSRKTAPFPKSASWPRLARIRWIVCSFVHRIFCYFVHRIVHLWYFFHVCLLFCLLEISAISARVSQFACRVLLFRRRLLFRPLFRRRLRRCDGICDVFLSKVILMSIFQPLWKRSPPLQLSFYNPRCGGWRNSWWRQFSISVFWVFSAVVNDVDWDVSWDYARDVLRHAPRCWRHRRRCWRHRRCCWRHVT